MGRFARSLTSIGLAATLVLSSAGISARGTPSEAVRTRVMRSLVYVRASDCRDHTPRAGSGFVFGGSGDILTAHHVVGGCANITVSFQATAGDGSRMHRVTVRRIFSRGDLALLHADDAPAVPALDLASPPIDHDATFAGLGYQNGQPSAGDTFVTFSSGSDVLEDILPGDAVQGLRDGESAIDFKQSVLRFGSSLQPGMSGGPIIDSDGRVIGIVAGGLKAGAAPASWGWPSSNIARLLASRETDNVPVRVSQTFYSLSEMNAEVAARQSRSHLHCGLLEFAYLGVKTFADISRGADDQQRLQYLKSITHQAPQDIDALPFQVWRNPGSGATLVAPAEYEVQQNGNTCVTRSTRGPFAQVAWGAIMMNGFSANQAASNFEWGVMYSLAPYNTPAVQDFSLTTMIQIRDGGLFFQRKGITKPKPFFRPQTYNLIYVHEFETLIAKSGTFLGVGTLDDDLPADINACSASNFANPGCGTVYQHLKEWTKFILVTQLSTYPST